MRIVSLLPAATEMLYLAGAGGDVVGVSHECNWPAEAAALPRVTRSNIDSAAGSDAIDQQVKSAIAHGAALYALDHTLLRVPPTFVRKYTLRPSGGSLLTQQAVRQNRADSSVGESHTDAS